MGEGRKLFMEKKIVTVIMLTLLLSSILTFASKFQPVRAEPKTWIVDDDGSADFASIQEAVNAANPGDTVYVKNGTYYENVIVNETISLTGESKENTIVDGGGVAAVIIVEEDNVLVTGFMVRNSGWEYYYDESSGIFIDRASSCNISDNIATNVRYGVSSWLGQDSIISHKIGRAHV